VASSISDDEKNTTGRDLIICRYFIHQENVCAISLKMMLVVTVLSKLVNLSLRGNEYIIANLKIS
jgi:hypothetical protein